MGPSKERERRRQRENSAREKREVKRERERRKRWRRTCLCVAGVAGVRANRRCPRSTKVRCFSPSFFCCFLFSFFILSNRSGSGHPLQLRVLTRPDQTSLGAARRAPRASREARVGRTPSLGCAPGHRGGALGCASLRPVPQARASMRL